MEEWLLHAADKFGYTVVFLGVGMESMGVPVPGETTLIIGAVLASQGHLQWWGVALAAWLGAVLGDNAGYWIGHRYGRRLMMAPGLRRIYNPRRIALAENWFARRGWLAVFFGRFIAILRIFAGPLAGMHALPWRIFVIANAAGAAIWATAVVVVGLVIGNNLHFAIDLISRLSYAGLTILVVAVVVVLIVKWRHYR